MGNWSWSCLLVLVVLLVKNVDGKGIPLTLLDSNYATQRGAFCLDGSPPGYHFDAGSGSGANNWLVHMEGGGWCETIEKCQSVKKIYKGSSSQFEKTMGFSGMLGGIQAANPDFYNWNRVKIRYCDQSSFTGDSMDPKTGLYFRGERVWQAIIDQLLAKGMKNAQNAILSGCSAGGLAAILHCDKFRSLLPASATVKCVADAGYFIHGKDITGAYRIENFYSQVVQLHGSQKNLPASCTSRNKPELCFFPEYVVQTMTTPLFIINAAYDSWQIKNILAPKTADRSGAWKSCTLDLKKCSATQLATVQNYKDQFHNAVTLGLGNRPSCGYFVDSCYAHCQAGSAATWLGDKSPQLGNTKIGKAVGDWFWGRATFRSFDRPYPSNPTCVDGGSES
ncbi:unnamed protein product [Cuscuta campestris]|uniref:Pectin acetylesterase n=1 Tax=Cuscuta campestris TaxID=132261 RepID=A0A484LL20_9ASTE|nr:unnamed protein product [Cuscuta campestris]